jgi:prepilin-type processing-associated H-X9-DG protein
MSGTYGQYAPWPVTHDYALNGGFLGFSYDPAHGARRLRGRIAAARMSSTVVLAGDTASVGIIWQPTLVAERPADLADVLTRNHAQVIGTTSGAYYAGFHGRDAVHKSGMNVLFVDGHAEYVSARVPDLQRCRLTN